MDASMPRLPRLTVVHLMKLVAYAAVGMGVVGPMVRLQQATGGPMAAVALFCAVSVPLAWAAVSFLLVRSGPKRDRLILACLLGSVAAALCVGLRFLWLLTGVAWRRGEELSWLAITLVVDLLLAAALVFLAGRLLGKSWPRAPARASTDRAPSPQASPR